MGRGTSSCIGTGITTESVVRCVMVIDRPSAHTLLGRYWGSWASNMELNQHQAAAEALAEIACKYGGPAANREEQPMASEEPTVRQHPRNDRLDDVVARSPPGVAHSPILQQRHRKRARPKAPETPAKSARISRGSLKVGFTSLARSLELEGTIGNGVAGAVWVARGKSGQAFALKKLKTPGSGTATGQREAAALERLGCHRNVVQLRCWAEAPASSEVWLILELWHHSLEHTLKAHRLQEWQMRPLMLQLLSALVHCHGAGVLHRDIKPANILLDANNTTLVLADFSHAALIDPQIGSIVGSYAASGQSSSLELSTEMVTPLYRAPEVWARQQYDAGVDIWAAGCVWGEALLGTRLIVPASCAQLIEVQTRKIQTELAMRLRPWNPLAQPVLCAKGFELLSRMLNVCPTGRCNAIQALQHPYFCGADTESVALPEQRPLPKRGLL